MVAGETKELTSVRRGGRGRAAASETALLSVSKGRSLHGSRATKQWVEDIAQCRGAETPNTAEVSSKVGISRTPSKKEGRVQFKQENEHSASKLVSPVSSFAPSSIRKDGFSDAQAAALSPLSLNSLPGFRQESRSSNWTSKPVALPDSGSHQQTHAPILQIPNTITDGKITLQQAVPCVRNEGGERKVVWCNPAFCEDSDERRFSNDSAASAQTTTDRRSPPSYLKSVVDLRGVGQELNLPEQIRRQPIVVVRQDESSSSLPSGQINNGVSFPEKFNVESSPFFSVDAVAGSPATVMTSIVEESGGCRRAHSELESASGSWYTPVMSSVTPERVAKSPCLDRFIDLSMRPKRTLAQLPTLKDTSSSQAFLSSTANHLRSGASAGLAPSAKDDIPGESCRRRPPSAYSLNYASQTATSDCGGSDTRSSRKLPMQPVVDEEAVKSQKSGNRAGRPTCRGADVTSSGKAQGPPQADFEAMVEADLEADIAREIEEEIAKEILYLSQRLADLHAKQELRRVAWGEKAGQSCPQTPLRCAPSPAETPRSATAASESKRRSGRVVAAKFLQSTTAERSNGVQSVDRSSRRRLLADSPFSGQVKLPKRSLGTPARLFAKLNSLPNVSSPDHHRTEQGLNSTCLVTGSKVSAEEYVRERLSADGPPKSKSVVLKEVFREDLEASRLAAASSDITSNLERPHQHARSLSIGSAVQSRYFPEFERKIDWVKSLRSETLVHSTSVPLNPVGKLMDDVFFSRQIGKDVQDIHTWLGESHESVKTEQETGLEPIHPPSSRSPVRGRDQSSSQTPRPKGRAIQRQPRSVSPVAPSPTPSRAVRARTTPTQLTPSSVVAAARSCSPSVRARTVPSRYGTPIRANSKAPGTSDLKRVADPKLVLESPVRKIDLALRSGGKESGSSSGIKGRASVGKSTIRKGYPGVAGLRSKAECGDTYADVHWSRRHHHHLSPAGKANDRGSTGGSNECMKRKDNFEAEYEKFVENAEVAEKQVSELYHAAMVNLSAAESSPKSEAVNSTSGYSSSARSAAKHTLIRCGDLIKGKAKPPFTLKGKRTAGQSVLPTFDGQDSDDSVLARSLSRTDSSEQDLEWKLITAERTADEQEVENIEVESTKDVDEPKQTPVSNGSAIDGGMVETLFQYEETLINERQRLSRIRAKSEGVQQLRNEESPRDSGCVKRTFDQHKLHPFSEFGKGQPHWLCSDNGVI